MSGTPGVRDRADVSFIDAGWVVLIDEHAMALWVLGNGRLQEVTGLRQRLTAATVCRCGAILLPRNPSDWNDDNGGHGPRRHQLDEESHLNIGAYIEVGCRALCR